METDEIQLEINRKQKSLLISAGASIALFIGTLGDLPILRETYYALDGVALITGSIGVVFILMIFNGVLGLHTLLGNNPKHYPGSQRYPLGFNFLGLAWVNLMCLYLRFIFISMPFWYHAGILLAGLAILILSRIFIRKPSREELFP